MNNPVKMLLATGVIAFAAAGLYYAMGAPNQRSSGTKLQLKSSAAHAPSTLASDDSILASRSEQPKANDAPVAAATPVVVTNAASAEGTSMPAQGVSSGSSTGVPKDFSKANEPMTPLPAKLDGFEKDVASNTTTTPVVTTIAAASPNAVPPSTVQPVGVQPSKSVSSTPLPVAAATVTTSETNPANAAGSPVVPSASPVKPVVASPSPTPVPAAAVAPQSTTPGTYVVAAGDSFASIWRSLSGSERGFEKFAAANPGVDPSRLQIGQVLTVPVMDGSAAGKPAGSAGASSAASKSSSSTQTGSGASTYTVASGDTLSQIAIKVYGSNKYWKVIHEANKDVIGSDPGSLKVGLTLKIPARSAVTSSSSTPPSL